MTFSAEIVGGELILRIPMNAKPERSSSGTPAGLVGRHREDGCRRHVRGVDRGSGRHGHQRGGLHSRSCGRQATGV